MIRHIDKIPLILAKLLTGTVHYHLMAVAETNPGIQPDIEPLKDPRYDPLWDPPVIPDRTMPTTIPITPPEVPHSPHRRWIFPEPEPEELPDLA